MSTRRRFLRIAATTGALASRPALAATRTAPSTSTWRGAALGAPAVMNLVHPDRDLARRTIAECVAEIQRLEATFSLYQPQSALMRLNTAGTLSNPPLELVELLSFALTLARRSNGAFDPTVQPLYRLLAAHFRQPGAAPQGPNAQAMAKAMAAVGHQHVELDAGRIRLHRPGMALTLNGVAQGYITDRVGDRLRRAGFQHVLIDVGEILALGRRADGRTWRAAIADPQRAGHSLFELELGNARDQLPALATSAGSGTPLDASGRWHHLLDPRSGRSAQHHASVTVAAPRAALADGLSTALSVLAPEEAADTLTAWPEARAWLAGPDGRIQQLGASA